jgi:hypothetical protein
MKYKFINLKVLVIVASILSSANLSAMQKSAGNGKTSASVSVGAQSASVGISRNVGSGNVGGIATGNYNGSGSVTIGGNIQTSKNSSVGASGTAGSWGGRYVTIYGSKKFRAMSKEMILEELEF